MRLERVCLLDPQYNECQYKGEGKTCNAPHSNCGMLFTVEEKEKPRSKYVRQPRWYEKYYR